MESSAADDDRTLIYSDLKAEKLSPEDMRSLLELPQGDALSDFSDLSTIGIGGVGTIYSAREPGLNREVALKVLRPEFRGQLRHINSFIREARVTAQIDHPNIVPVHRIGVSQDVGIYFTMRRIDGETLRSAIAKLAKKRAGYRRRYSLQRRLEIFVSICQGVAFAHKRGIIHRDLKPGNIMLGDYGEVLILDWGLAAYRKGDRRSGKDGPGTSGGMPAEDASDSERKPVISGTPAYMAPEQASGSGEIDERTDVYGLGAILYSLLTLEPAPFDSGKPTKALLRDIVAGRLLRPRLRAPLQRIPRELEAITMKAMACRKADRYASVQSLIRDVRNYLDKYPVEAYSPNRLYRLLKLCVRRPLVPVTMLVAAVSAGGVYLAYLGYEYIQTSSMMQVARYNLSQAESCYNLAMGASRLLRRSSEQGSLTRRAQLNEELSRQSTEFFGYCGAVMESLSAIENGGPYSVSTRSEAVDIMAETISRQIRFCIATGNDRMLESLVRRLNSRWRLLRPHLFQRNQELAARMRRVEKAESILQLNLPGSGTAYLRRDDAASPPAAGETWRPVEPDARLEHLHPGSYLVRLDVPGRSAVCFPVVLSLGGEVRVELAAVPDIPRGMVLVPGGDFYCSGVLGNSQAQAVNLPAFLMDRHEVTFGQYLEFWKQLPTREEKERYMGRFSTPDRKVHDLWDADGRLAPTFDLNLPVVGITGKAAEAYCLYLRKKTGVRYRLPTIYEWEKAGRGADTRAYVWGDEFRADAALLRNFPRRSLYPTGAPPGTFPLDQSVYGVEDLTGNVREFVKDPDASGDIYNVMGGSYLTDANQALCWSIGSCGDSENDIGFRCAADLQGGARDEPRSEPEMFQEDVSD